MMGGSGSVAIAALTAAIQIAALGTASAAFGQSTHDAVLPPAATTAPAALPPLPAPDADPEVESAPAESAPANPAAPPVADASHAMVWVHLDGPGGVRLEQDLDSRHHTDWETVCVSPCDAWVDSAFDYRVAGGLTKASKDFSLQVPAGARADLHVNAASKLWFVIGWVGIGAGAGTVGFAVSVILGTALLSASLGDGSNDEASVYPAALALAGVGAAVGVGSYFLMRANLRTTVSQDRPTRSTEPAASLREAPASRPSWSEAAPSWAPFASPTVVPIVSGRF